MSKQIAQTVGDKRVAVLIALLAAFAVLAVLATQWQKSEATPSPGSYSLTGPWTVSDCTVPPPAGGVLSGTTVYYCIAKAADATLAGDLAVTFNAVSGLTYTGVVNPVSGPVPSCSGGGSTITCTYDSLNENSTFQLAAAAVVTQSIPAAQPTGTADDESLGTAAIASTTLALPVLNVETAFNKSNTTQSVAQAGGVATWTLTFTVPAGFTANAGQIVFSDTINPVVGGSTLIQVTPTGMTCGISGAVSLPTPVPLSCSNTAAVVGQATVSVAFSVQIPADPDVADPGDPPPTRLLCNTATATIQMNGGNASDTDGPICQLQTGLGATNDDTEGLVHLDIDGDPETIRDHENDVIGYRHTVCAKNDVVDAIWPSIGGGGLNDAFNNFQITPVSGTPTVEAPVVTTAVDCDDDGFFDDSTVSWYSVSPGEQNIIVVNDAGVAQYGWSGTGVTTVPLVKEWNTLAPTWITAGSGVTISGTPDAVSHAGGNLDGKTVTGGYVFNPATGKYEGLSTIYYENPIATHTNGAGTQLYIAYGANVTFTRSAGTCGTVVVDGINLWSPGDTHTVVSEGLPIPFRFDSFTGNPSDCTSITGSTTVSIAVTYPTLLGSDQPPQPAVETLTINWTGTVASKQVFLAWAGQRVILEHDWRLPAGDVKGGSDDNDPDELGTCIFNEGRGGSQEITYIKGSGPGNFLPGEDVDLNGSDQATVWIDTSDNSQTDSEDIPGSQGSGDLNGMCISRILFESEDQGQVDIEAFAADNATTKIAFVIYYMKINTINVSLVTQVEKPSHNSSNPSYADYAPGNPWDASKDDADNAADWNVSKDLLVRGRVSGWFTNSNPSGRAADTSNPLNVLPANRWVMPQDWPLLAGGPADPADGTDAIGTAEQFRPYYDIMFAPNNTRGISLGNPTGTSTNQAAVVVAVTGVTNTATVFRVTTCNDLAAYQANGGSSIYVGATPVTMTSCVGTTLTIGAGLAGAPAAGTLVSISSGTPFEGPYSTLDIIGLASQGLGGAALSDFDEDNIRDTMLDDGDVDWWDAPMPVAPVSVAIRGTGFIKQVLKSDVYYNGTVNNPALQVYPNPYYIIDIPASPFISAQAAGGGYFWDTWGPDGPGDLGQRVYNFWQPAITGTNSAGIGDSFTTAQTTELAAIRTAYGDNTIARDLVIYSDNHGEFMVTANGDYRTDLTACATNVLAGGKHCKPGDHVGTGTITATVDYPDFRGKHFPVLSNAATVTWTWGGYKDVTVEAGETDQFKYVVFHGLDRDGFCSSLVKPGSVSLHPVLSSWDDDNTIGAVDPVESIDFLIDSGEGIIIGQSGGGTINDGKQFATGLPTFSTIENDPAVTGIKEFPASSVPGTVPVDECQAWIKVSNSLLGVLNILAIAHDDEGNIGFDEIIDLTNTTSYTLTFRWSLITWAGADAIPVSDAIKGTGTSGKNPGGNDISSQVTAIYGWAAPSQTWLGYFPTGVNVPGANDLITLENGEAYWIAIVGPSSVTWTIASNVN